MFAGEVKLPESPVQIRDYSVPVKERANKTEMGSGAKISGPWHKGGLEYTELCEDNFWIPKQDF